MKDAKIAANRTDDDAGRRRRATGEQDDGARVAVMWAGGRVRVGGDGEWGGGRLGACMDERRCRCGGARMELEIWGRGGDAMVRGRSGESGRLCYVREAARSRPSKRAKVRQAIHAGEPCIHCGAHAAPPQSGGLRLQLPILHAYAHVFAVCEAFLCETCSGCPLYTEMTCFPGSV